MMRSCSIRDEKSKNLYDPYRSIVFKKGYFIRNILISLACFTIVMEVRYHDYTKKDLNHFQIFHIFQKSIIFYAGKINY